MGSGRRKDVSDVSQCGARQAPLGTSGEMIQVVMENEVEFVHVVKPSNPAPTCVDLEMAEDLATFSSAPFYSLEGHGTCGSSGIWKRQHRAKFGGRLGEED